VWAERRCGWAWRVIPASVCGPEYGLITARGGHVFKDATLLPTSTMMDNVQDAPWLHTTRKGLPARETKKDAPGCDALLVTDEAGRRRGQDEKQPRTLHHISSVDLPHSNRDGHTIKSRTTVPPLRPSSPNERFRGTQRRVGRWVWDQPHDLHGFANP
jgi:hypothetical protein